MFAMTEDNNDATEDNNDVNFFRQKETPRARIQKKKGNSVQLEVYVEASVLTREAIHAQTQDSV